MVTRGGHIQKFNCSDIHCNVTICILLTVLLFSPSQNMVCSTRGGNMLVDDFKLFLHGLPPDCQESALKDFLEGTCVLLMRATFPLNKMQQLSIMRQDNKTQRNPFSSSDLLCLGSLVSTCLRIYKRKDQLPVV